MGYMTSSLLVFGILQLADIVSTMIFLSMGIHEANPLISALMRLTSPMTALVVVKLLGICLGLTWYKTGRNMTWVNTGFFLLILWNVMAIYGTPKALLRQT